MEDKEIMETLEQKLIEQGCWFSAKADITYSEPVSYYKLDEYGYPTEQTSTVICNEVKDLIGDGAIDTKDAIEVWIQKQLEASKLAFTEQIKTVYKTKPIIDQIKIQQKPKANCIFESVKTRLEEENTKSLNIISSMFASKDFDAESNYGKIVMRTSELFNTLSDKGYDVQVGFDNGESQSTILLGKQGGLINITITNDTTPLKAYVSGNIEVTNEIIKVLQDIINQIRSV